jgi:type I restriction enzyme, S subunit
VARVRKTDLPCVLNRTASGNFPLRENPKRRRVDAEADFDSTPSGAWSRDEADYSRDSAERHHAQFSNTFPCVAQEDSQSIRDLPLPPLAEQKAIAAVLGALDDKIELNRRMNATLEAMARALFQSWFVDFDPVRAKLDGRQPPNLDPATAALFPDHFGSEAGHIPKGWEVKTLSELTCLITKGTTPTQNDMTGAPISDAQINYVRVNSIDEDGSVLAEKLTTIPESVHAGVLKRSVLMANDVLYTIAGTIGRIAVAEDWLLPANTNQAVAIIRPETEIPSGFLMLTMRHEAFREELHNNIVHAVQANLSLGMLSKARVVVPPPSVLPQLFRPIDALLSQISANRAQSRTLATLRDTLLPKLLSGELSVAESTN